MSHWTKGKLKMKCSLAVLQRALIKVMPSWKDHIKVSESGELTAYNSYTGSSSKGYHLVVPGGDNPMGGKVAGVRSAPGLSYADVGFKKNKDGTWSVQIDRGGLPYDHRQLENEISEEAATQTLEATAASRGWGAARQPDGSLIVIRPIEARHQLRA